MLSTGTGLKTRLLVVVVCALQVVGVATLPLRWRAVARRSASFLVYYVGYRVLSVHLSCQSLAVSAVPFVIRHA